jgi:phage baseplate assembly protein W
MGVIENDLNPDVTIGLELPLQHTSTNGFFTLTNTMLEQTKSNIKNLLLTHKGERLGNPTFGSDLHFAIFEQEGDVESRAEEAIRSAMTEWLPFVIIKDIKAKFSDKNKVVIALQFAINIDTTTTEMLTFDLAPEV